MKVLYVLNSLDMGGAEKLVVDIMCKLKNDEIDLYVLNRNANNMALTNRVKEAGIRILNCGVDSNKSVKHIKWLMKNMNSYEVVHSHLSYSQYYVSVAAILKTKVSAKLITTEHSTNNKRMNRAVFKKIEKVIYSKYDSIVTINQGTYDSFLKWQTTLRNKLKVINNGVDLERYQNNSDIEIKDGKNLIMVAAFRREKNHRILIEAMRNLETNFKLKLVGGGDTEVVNEVKQLVKQYALEKRVEFLGIREDIPRLLSKSDMFILPSKWEGFGLVAIEAMAAKIPVIASDVEGLASVVGGVGKLFNPASSSELATCIRSVSEDKTLRKTMIESGIKRSEKYDLKATVEKYLELYYEMKNKES